MNPATWACFWTWFRTLPRAVRAFFHLVWGAELFTFLLILLAPNAAAQGVDSILGFTGIGDSYGVPTSANMWINADDALFEWNGVLPKLGNGTSITNGFANVFGSAQTTLIVVTVCSGLWLIRGLRSVMWNDIIGSIFKAVGFSLDQVVNSGPFLAIGLTGGLFVGIALIAFGRGVAGRATIGVTFGIATIGLLFGKNIVTRLLEPSGWMSNVRAVSESAAATIMRRGREIGSAQTTLDSHFRQIETGMADFTRQSLQQAMLGTVVDPPKPPKLGGAMPETKSLPDCSMGWTEGQKSGNSKALGQLIAQHCPEQIIDRIQDPQPMLLTFLWVLLIACIFVASVFSWRGLSSLFKASATAGVAPMMFIYALFPGFPRRFGKMAANDFIVQVGKYGLYNILTGIYVLILGVCFMLPFAKFHVDFLVAKLAITAILMLLFNGWVNHMADLHRAAMGQPSGKDVTAKQVASPILSAAGGAAAMGLAGASAARAGSAAARGGGGSGRPVNNRGTSSRINAGLQAAQSAFGFRHPAAAAVGAMAGGFGSAGVGALASRRAEKADAKSDGGGRRPAGRSDSSGPGGRQQSPAEKRAQQTRQDAAHIARQAQANRPATGKSPKPISRTQGTPVGSSSFNYGWDGDDGMIIM
ncbi:hypothetical protein [Mycobacteroides abscessus]|uniref:hypothetical protein n=1 Tax=Mycobacteroides abscessus TaxID=36809 RepID=UPI00092B6B5B|nr:hypothetical protein [Mycobacteroides abscessus]SIC21604.1 Uncharacterised protein [Mycobacteroides abscessus subsp. abscessus]